MIWTFLFLVTTLHHVHHAVGKRCTETKCPKSMTCCVLPEGEGCCPYQDAVCCEDQIHCCPKGYTCDGAHGKCTMETANGIHTLMASEINSGNLTTVRCPDGRICPDVSTCCLIHPRVYGCCPYYNAVCCSDLVHCCPQYTVCNAGFCHSAKSDTDNDITEEMEQIALNENICSDSSCPSDQTCCPTVDGSSACCPYKSAVCCAGMDMCCPNGYQCDNSESKCVKQN